MSVVSFKRWNGMKEDGTLENIEYHEIVKKC